MSKRFNRGAAASVVSLAVALTFTSTVAAHAGSHMYQANLTQLNGSGTTGTATVKQEGNQATVTVNVTGASPNLAHAQHIHIGVQGSCPASPTGTNKDGEPNTISATEAEKAYGPVRVSLTTSGAVDANSALAVDRMPKADAQGRISYSRTFTLPNGVTGDDLGKGVIEMHGISSLTGDKAKYDGTKKSELDNKLPAEATLPSACGKLTAMPTGGVATGGGSTAGTEHTGLFAVGAVSLIAAGSFTLLHLRRAAVTIKK